VSPPLRKRQWEETVPTLVDALLGANAQAYKAPNGTYGIHLTMHRRHLSPLQESRMLMFLLAEENQNFARAIAQRSDIYSASNWAGIGRMPKDRQKMANIGKQAAPRRTDGALRDYTRISAKQFSLGKFSPINFDSGRDLAECRIFQASITSPSILKNLEFYHALMQWTRPVVTSGTGWSHVDFVKWLGRQMVGKKTLAYPTLVEYLKRPKYLVRRGTGAIDNTWGVYL